MPPWLSGLGTEAAGAAFLVGSEAPGRARGGGAGVEGRAVRRCLGAAVTMGTPGFTALPVCWHCPGYLERFSASGLHTRACAGRVSPCERQGD